MNATSPFFEDFTLETIAVEGGNIRLRRSGTGQPLLMLRAFKRPVLWSFVLVDD